MNPNTLALLNEAYRHGVYNEETLSEEEMLSIEEWVEALIEEGYDLDQYSDEELYEAYLSDLDEGLTGPRKEYALKRANELRDRSRQAGDIAKRNRGGRHGISDKMHKRAADLVRVATREVGGETYPRKEKGSWETLPRKRGGSGIKGDPKDMDSGVDHSRSAKSDKDLIKSKLRKRALRNINRGMNEELDLYDIVSEYLVSEGFCDSYEDADVIMANMSEEWRESIVNNLIEEGFVSPYKAPHAHGRSMDNTGRLSPAMKAMKKSDDLQKTEPGSERQKMQTRRSGQLNRMFSAARNA